MSLKTGVRWSPSAAQRVILEHVDPNSRAPQISQYPSVQLRHGLAQQLGVHPRQVRRPPMPKHALRRRRRNRRIFCNLIDGGAAPVPAQVQVWYQNRRQRERSQGTKGAAEMLVRRAHDGVPIRAPATRRRPN